MSSQFAERIEGVTAGDLMDAEPVAVPRETTALAAQDEFFLRYRLPWFPVVDAAGACWWACCARSAWTARSPAATRR